MCGLFPCIPTFKGFIFLKKLVQVGNLNVCVKLIGWLAAIDTAIASVSNLNKFSLLKTENVPSFIQSFKLQTERVLRFIFFTLKEGRYYDTTFDFRNWDNN